MSATTLATSTQTVWMSSLQKRFSNPETDSKYLEENPDSRKEDETLLGFDLARQVCPETLIACNNAKIATAIPSAKTVAAAERLARDPVFTVALKYDPNGPNQKYYNALYAAMAEANGYHSFSLVDIELGVILNIGVKGKHKNAED